MAKTAVRVSSASKRFKLYHNLVTGPLKEQLFFWRPQRYYQEFWAVKDISFDVTGGEVVGIIGPNGAGKSTLLKMIAGLLSVDKGAINVNGKVTALLALAALNTLLIGWATVTDFLRGTALLRALGATTNQLAAGITAANLVPAAIGGTLAIPVGLAVFRVGTRLAGVKQAVVVPPLWWLACVPVGTLVVVAALMVWPARAGAQRSVSQILAGESGH